MPGSRALKNIAHGLVETFMSRNNDVFGYWGIGQIHRELEGHPIMIVELDLLHEKATPDGQIARQLATRYSTYLFESLSRDGFTSSAVTAAKVLLEFDTIKTPETAGGVTWRAFNCKVALTSSSGKVFCAMRASSSHPHDPNRERCSNRAQVQALET